MIGPLVSVIIPIYNTPLESVLSAVESVFSQHCSVEVLLINDGSNEDLSARLCQLVSKASKPLKLIHKDNGGVSSARNLGIDLAKGQYITFLDADDVLADNFLKRALEIVSEENCDVVFGCVEYVRTDGSTFHYGNPELSSRVVAFEGRDIDAVRGCLFNKRALERVELKPAMYAGSYSALFSRATIGDCRFDETVSISEDRLFNYEVLSKCKKIAITGDVWYRYIQTPGSASQRLRENAREELLRTASVLNTMRRSVHSPLADDINQGIVECFYQTLGFTVLRKEWDVRKHGSRRQFVSELFRCPVYQMAFRCYKPLTPKQRLLRFFGAHRLAILLMAGLRINELLSLKR